MNKKKWIWQQDDYPDFKYDTALLEPILLNIKYHQGLLDGIYASIHEDDLVKTQLEILTK